MDENTIINLYWGNNRSGWHLVKEKLTTKAAWEVIPETLNQKPLYYNCHMTENEALYIDYGSHINFFQMRPVETETETVVPVVPDNTNSKTNKRRLNNMSKMNQYGRNFPSMLALLNNVDMKSTICRFYDEDGGAIYKIIIGATILPNDVMLHLVDAEGLDVPSDIEKAIQGYGVEMRLLSQMMSEFGFDIVPSDQIDFVFNEKSNHTTPTPTPTPAEATATKTTAAQRKTISGQENLEDRLNHTNKAALNTFEVDLDKDTKKMIEVLEGFSEFLNLIAPTTAKSSRPATGSILH